MKSSKKIALTILFLSLIVFNSNAQKKIVYGKVMAFEDIPVQLADVTIKKSKTSTSTDSLGGFQIESKVKDKISIKVAGFKTKTIKVKNLTDSIHVNLVFDGEEEDILLAASKGQLKKSLLPKAIKYFNTPIPYAMGYVSVEALLRGKFPEAKLSNGEIFLRGLTDGALIIIDGTESNMFSLKSIALSSIKKIEILKGPSAARYGSAAANGVVFVHLVSF